MDCPTLKAKLPAWMADLVLSPEEVPAAVRDHLAGCPGCAALVERERSAMAKTMELLDGWEAPEVSPYFASRMGALLREEQAKGRPGLAGWWERVRTGMLVTNFALRPVLGGGALALLLIAGGGAWLDLSQQSPEARPAAQASPTVRDLQSLDENAPVFQQLSSIDAGDDGPGTL